MTKPVSRSELTRLGKRGSYRLGTLAPQGIAGPAPLRQFRPSFGRPARSASAWARLATALAGVGLVAAGALAGLWFLPFVVGFVTGIAARWGRWRRTACVCAVLGISALGWGAALLGLALRGLPVGATARTIAALAGLPAYAAVAVAVTLGVAMVLGLVGLWLGRALTPR
jgi:hypothetical protein